MERAPEPQSVPSSSVAAFNDPQDVLLSRELDQGRLKPANELRKAGERWPSATDKVWTKRRLISFLIEAYQSGGARLPERLR